MSVIGLSIAETAVCGVFISSSVCCILNYWYILYVQFGQTSSSTEARLALSYAPNFGRMRLSLHLGLAACRNYFHSSRRWTLAQISDQLRVPYY